MGLRFRKSKKIGPFRVTMSKSGISYSAGVKGFRVTKTASGRVRTTASIPGTGISYVKESGGEPNRSNTARAIPSQQEFNTSPPVKTTKLVPLIGIILLLGMFFYNMAINFQSRNVEEKSSSKEEVIQQCMRIAEDYRPGAVEYEFDKARDTFTLFVWDDSFAPAGKAAKAGDTDALDAWDELLTSLKKICASMQIKFRDAGYGTTVAVAAVDPGNHDTVYVLVSKSKVLYDATWN